MEPLTAMPPLPGGRAAIDAWRTVDRQVRRRLLAGEPAPDPTTAVIAVGYARTLLSRTLRHRLVIAFATAGIVVVAGVPVVLIWPSAWLLWTLFVIIGAVTPRVLIQRRYLQLIRMENLNAGRLWATEVPAPQPAPAAPVAPGQTTEVRYSTAALIRVYGLLGGLLVGCPLVMVLLSGVTAFSIGYVVAMAIALVWILYATLRWTRPWLPVLVLDGDGLLLPAQECRTPWSQIIELRITPVRGGTARNPRHRIASFMVADPQAALAGRRGPHLRRGRIAIKAYGTPLSITDRLLTCTAEDIVSAAAAFTTAPVRRFGG